MDISALFLILNYTKTWACAEIKLPNLRNLCGDYFENAENGCYICNIMTRNLYIYQHKEWPSFTWDTNLVMEIVAKINLRQGQLIGRMIGLGLVLKDEAALKTMTLEILKSNEIEGEILDSDQVRSSIARRLGMDVGGVYSKDRHVEGLVDVMIDATQNFKEALTADRLFNWHAALFPTGRSGMRKIVVAGWRSNKQDDPMQVVSGAMGKEKIHFQAPEASKLKKEMASFLKWFNTSNDPALLKAAIAHLWFVTIHPFDDGNGRIARTIADMQLARADGIQHRFYSMSAQIRLERKQYYDALEKTQKGSLDITSWLQWFLACLDRALTSAEKELAGVIYKAVYWDWLSAKNIQKRQKIMINKLLDGFVGKLNTSKWAAITKCSQDTAYRDILDLIEQGILEKEAGGGRSTSYKLKAI